MLCEQYCVKFVPIDYHKREGRSHVRYFRDTARSVQIIVQCMLRYNPLKAFLALSLVALLPMTVFLGLSVLRPEYLLGAAMFGAVFLLTLGMGMMAFAAGRQHAPTAIDAGVHTCLEVGDPVEPVSSVVPLSERKAA
jgi:hypothetical protein